MHLEVSPPWSSAAAFFVFFTALWLLLLPSFLPSYVILRPFSLLLSVYELFIYLTVVEEEEEEDDEEEERRNRSASSSPPPRGSLAAAAA